MTAVNKGTQVLLIVEAWSKSYYFAILFVQGIALFICWLCLHLTTQERLIKTHSLALLTPVPRGTRATSEGISHPLSPHVVT